MKKQGRIRIAVTGMTCASCVRLVETALSEQNGVSRASVNFASETATVEYDPQVTDAARLVAVVEDAGYGAD